MSGGVDLAQTMSFVSIKEKKPNRSVMLEQSRSKEWITITRVKLLCGADIESIVCPEKCGLQALGLLFPPINLVSPCLSCQQVSLTGLHLHR